MVKTYEKALNLIKIRPHHSTELSRKLLMRGFDRDEVAQVIERLTNEGLLNDQQFAMNYLESLIKYKTFGFYGLKAKLMQRGIASNTAEKLLNDNFSLNQEKEIALKLLDKNKDPDKLKLAQKLSRKGFRTEIIKDVTGL